MRKERKLSACQTKTDIPFRPELSGMRSPRRHGVSTGAPSNVRTANRRTPGADYSLSKLFRNVPCLTHERMSPWWFVFLGSVLRLEVRDAGRPERSAGRPESRTSSRTARPWALIPFQNFRPTPIPSRRHGWSWAGGFTAVVVFTFRAFFTGEFLRTTPLG